MALTSQVNCFVSISNIKFILSWYLCVDVLTKHGSILQTVFNMSALILHQHIQDILRCLFKAAGSGRHYELTE